MSKSTVVLDKLLDVKPVEVFAEELSNAYSTKAYRNGWIPCIKMLRKRGYLDSEIEIIIRSKFTRWARDNSKNRYGCNSASDLAKFIDENPKALEALLEE